MTSPHFHAVLFDLDGTLLDTAPDLKTAINRLRAEHGLGELSLEALKPILSHGSKAMIRLALGIDETHHQFNNIRQHFLALYQETLAEGTAFFPQMETVLNYLESHAIPWGIVTNKLTRHTTALLKKLSIDHRAACVVCGDSLSTYKPDPGTILHACQLLKLHPKDCLYIGDCETDVMASKAAGIKSLVALYGYIGKEEDPLSWKADGYVQEPIEIINWLQSQ